MLKLYDVTKDYVSGDTVVHALRGVTLAFRKNEFVSVLGASGCGKTTLLNIVGGLDKYTSGDLVIKGVSTVNFEDRDWDAYRNNAIGFVFQNYNLIPHLDVLSNVELALTLAGVPTTERKRRAKEALKKVGLEDQINKKPNQLSGGQMQRVAIARALINDPEIILADEPTGALDSVTSEQIMELLHEVAKDRLVIMVTHNADIAERYSSRIITLSDGKVIGDTNPVEVEKRVEETPSKNKKKKTAPEFRRTSMSFLTALKLSLKNLFTKKTRTLLTSFAGSIGIIGIALVLAISSGLTNYINKMQTDTMSEFPLTVTTSSIDFLSMMGELKEEIDKERDENKIYVNDMTGQMNTLMRENNITEEYVSHVESLDPNLYSRVSVNRSVNLNLFKKTEITGMPMSFYLKIETSVEMSQMSSATTYNLWEELTEDKAYFDENYTLLNGSKMPEGKNEILLIVDSYNRISDIELSALGLTSLFDADEIDVSKIIGTEYFILDNGAYYTKNPDNTYSAKTRSMSFGSMEVKLFDGVLNTDMDGVDTLKIVGVAKREKGNTSMGSVLYTSALREYVISSASQSDIVKDQLKPENENVDVISGMEFGTQTSATNLADRLYALGATSSIEKITIFPKDFDSKEAIKVHLDKYNEGKAEEDVVEYTDIIESVVDTMSVFIDAISYVLIAFTSVSLVVSSIMIGIITYVSVIERTKEIGVLRAMGARKKDIARVFNAETLIIGFSAGLFGVLVTVLLSFPINLILQALVGPSIGNIAQLPFTAGVLLVLISMGLTFIAGLVPSRIAAKKDPVIALRTE